MKTNATTAPLPIGVAPTAEETPKPSVEDIPEIAPTEEETPKPKRTRGRKKAAKANKD